MEDVNKTVLPYICEFLSQQPFLTETKENIQSGIKSMIVDQNLAIANADKAIQNSLQVGENLGILTVQEEVVRMPFKVNKAQDLGARPRKAKRKVIKENNIIPKEKMSEEFIEAFLKAVEEENSNGKRKNNKIKAYSKAKSKKLISRVRGRSRR